MERREVWLRSPLPPRAALERFSENFGPLKMILAQLNPESRAAYLADLEKLWKEDNLATDGASAIRTEYLEVIATRASSGAA